MKLGPFIIEEEIGSGAMGAVYKAQYRDQALRVAVKIMAPGIGSGETAQARFQREADILKNLQHPNIVRLLAVGHFKNSPFYAMEFIHGETLESVLVRRRKLPWEEVVRIGQQLCDALQHAHEREIVHRDLKPGNIMLLPDGTLKLTDFGIAKVLDMSGLTATNCTVGTAAYMSPEQCRGDHDLSHKSDLYSMGVLFYELLTGRKPFIAPSTMDMFIQHVHTTVKRPSTLQPDLPVWLDTLICQLLEKAPEDRPASARVVHETLTHIEEKFQARQSVGLERATSRTGEKAQHRPRLDEADRDAVRALVGKKKKKKNVAFYERGWFTILALVVLLAGMAGGGYYIFFVPPSLESLHQQTKAILDAGDTYENWMAARDRPLKEFHEHYANETGPVADWLRACSDDVNGKIADQQLLARRHNKMPADAKGEKLAREALDLEDKGYLTEAQTAWKNLMDNQLKDSDPEKRAWALVGKRRLDQIKRLSMEWIALAKLAIDDKNVAGQSPEEKLAVEGFRAHAEFNALVTRAKSGTVPMESVRADLEKKKEAARGLWDRLSKKTSDDDEHRDWFLLAAYQLHELDRQLRELEEWQKKAKP
jgi:serine/threonine-protein kinase